MRADINIVGVQRLAGQPLDAIYCSPQPRTQQTARPLAGSNAPALDLAAALAYTGTPLSANQGLSLSLGAALTTVTSTTVETAKVSSSPNAMSIRP